MEYSDSSTFEKYKNSKFSIEPEFYPENLCPDLAIFFFNFVYLFFLNQIYLI